MKFPNLPNIDRSIDMLVMAGVAIVLKSLFPIPISLLEIMGLTGTAGMWLLGQLRAIKNQYPYESSETIPIYYF